MALSNWDTMCWDSNGETCKPSIFYKGKINIGIRKDVVVVSTPEDMDWMTISESNMWLYIPGTRDSLFINAIRCRSSQNGIFVYARFSHTVIDNDGRYIKTDRERFFGIGVYGYTGETMEDESKWVGVLPETEQMFRDWIYNNKEDEECDCVEKIDKDNPNFGTLIDINCRKTGTFTPIDTDLPNLQPGLRSNQGDSLFVDHGIIESVYSTPAGKAEIPILQQVIENMSEMP